MYQTSVSSQGSAYPNVVLAHVTDVDLPPVSDLDGHWLSGQQFKQRSSLSPPQPRLSIDHRRVHVSESDVELEAKACAPTLKSHTLPRTVFMVSMY
jgi:hypothetical protein